MSTMLTADLVALSLSLPFKKKNKKLLLRMAIVVAVASVANGSEQAKVAAGRLKRY